MSVVKTCDPQTRQKCRVTLGVTGNTLNGSLPVSATAVLGKLAQVVKAAPLRRRHWPQWQCTTLLGAASACRVIAVQ